MLDHPAGNTSVAAHHYRIALSAISFADERSVCGSELYHIHSTQAVADRSPIVPLIPDIDLINAIGILFLYAPHPRGHPQYSALKYRTLYIYGMQLLTSDVNPIVDLTIRSTSQS